MTQEEQVKAFVSKLKGGFIQDVMITSGEILVKTESGDDVVLKASVGPITFTVDPTPVPLKLTVTPNIQLVIIEKK